MKSICVVLVFCFSVLRWTEAFLTDEPYCTHGDPLPDIFCGRGPSHQACPVGYSCHVHPADAWAVCCQSGVRRRRSNPQIDLLRNKLSNLQTLLKDIEKKPETQPVKTNDIEEAKESQMSTSQAPKGDNLKYKLTEEEIEILKALKETLNRKEEEKNGDQLKQELKNNGIFYDDSKEIKQDEVTVLKALAAKLSKENKIRETKVENEKKSESSVDQKRQSDGEDTNDLSKSADTIQPKEGKFTLFRQEVLAQVEDRLLQDMDFGMKMGFTIQEILEDLQLKEKRFEQLKLAEMKEELERLKALSGRE